MPIPYKKLPYNRVLAVMMEIENNQHWDFIKKLKENMGADANILHRCILDYYERRGEYLETPQIPTEVGIINDLQHIVFTPVETITFIHDICNRLVVKAPDEKLIISVDYLKLRSRLASIPNVLCVFTNITDQEQLLQTTRYFVDLLNNELSLLPE